MQAFYPLKFKLSAPKASRPGSTSIFPCPWRRQSACKPAKKSSGNCWIALNYTWYENSYLSSKPLKGQAKATKLLCRPPQNRLPKTNGAAAPTQVAPDPPVRENLIHDFLSAYEILGLARKSPKAKAFGRFRARKIDRSQVMKMISGSKVSHKIRLIIAIRLLILFLSIAFAVAFLTTRTLAEDKVVELKFTLWGSPFEKQAIEKAVASFNASHPNIHVTAQHIPYEAYGEKISAMLAAGEPPDVAYLDFAQAFPFADGGKILDLTSYFAKQPTDQGVLETSFYRFDHGKKLLGTGLATGVILLYYNKALFDAAKLPYPPATAQDAWTWDKFVEVAKKLTKDRNGNDATNPKFDPNNIETYGLSLPQDWWSYITFIDSNGGSFVNKEGTELLLNRPESVQVLQALQDAIFVDHISPRPTQNKALPSADILMQSGKVAMTFNPSSTVSGDFF